MLYNINTKKETHWPHGLPIPAHIREILTLRHESDASPFFRVELRARFKNYRQTDSIDGNKSIS
jgi:hypothetical protein